MYKYQMRGKKNVILTKQFVNIDKYLLILWINK